MKEQGRTCPPEPVAPLAGAILEESRSAPFPCFSRSLPALGVQTDLSDEDLEKLEQIVGGRRRFKRGGALFRVEDPFVALMVIRAGFVKTSVMTPDGREQVTGFHMAGDVIGMDGIMNNHHQCNAIAIEDVEVCVVPFANLQLVSQQLPKLQRDVLRMLSNEIVREHEVLLLLGSMHAEERLAAFLLNLAQRLHQRGFSQTELVLRMTRQEIGSFLGLTLETISRCFSKLAADGIIEIQLRHLRILKPDALRDLVNPSPCKS